MEGGDGFDWRKDAQDSYDLALSSLRAAKWGLAVRHGHKGAPIEAVMFNGDGQWGVVRLTPRHALELARQLVEYGLRELGE